MASIDPSAFNAYERRAWDTVAAAYISGFGDLVQQSISPLLDDLHLDQGMRLLDVASGSGWLAAAARERGASVVGVDASATMLDEARRRYLDIPFHPGSAEALPFGDSEFDAVACNFGMLHFGQPEQALREAHRVLRPGGRVAFTVWAPPDQTIGFGIVLGAIQAHGRVDVGLPPGPPFFRFGDPAESIRTLREAGFDAASVRTVPQVWRLPSAESLFNIMCEGTGRTRGLLLGQTDAARAAIGTSIIAEAQRYARGGFIELPMPAVLSSAENLRT